MPTVYFSLDKLLQRLTTEFSMPPTHRDLTTYNTRTFELFNLYKILIFNIYIININLQ